MDGQEQRTALAALIAREGASLGALSRMLRRNDAWLQQYLRRGTPKLLPEAERRQLARFFGVEDQALGGPQSAALVAVPRLNVTASAGAGRIVEDETAAAIGYASDTLARLGVAAGEASEIAVAGDSMEPTLHDGDRILVDRGQRRPGARGGVWVIRVDDALSVKRLVDAGSDWRIVSDNPGWPDVLRAKREVEVLGRVVQLVRQL